jgi:hypothetical protein
MKLKTAKKQVFTDQFNELREKYQDYRHIEKN